MIRENKSTGESETKLFFRSQASSGCLVLNLRIRLRPKDEKWSKLSI